MFHLEIDPMPSCCECDTGLDIRPPATEPSPEDGEPPDTEPPEVEGLGGMRLAGEVSPEIQSPKDVASLLASTTSGEWMRSVSLRKTLWHPGRFWFADPHARSPSQKLRLFHSSAQTKHFDMFISHTWETDGKWKYLSLLLQCGWPTILMCWAFGVILAFGLCMADVLPLFISFRAFALDFEEVVAAGCWIQVFGLLGIFVGCILFSHLPFKSDQCFLDFACIDQTDSIKMQQGIMSISSFLAASKELRVLWSAPLLSRLWCVFEIAAYRKLKPTGKIVLAPVDNEFSACMMFLWWQVATLVFCLLKAIATDAESLPAISVLALALGFCCLVPALAHATWRNHQSSSKLRSDLANFDVMQVDCSSDFDRECIHGAIISWYGSLEAFSEHVRGAFSKEVLELMRVNGSMSSHYIILPLSPSICFFLENVLALIKAGAPATTVIAAFFSQVVALNLLFLPAMGIFFTYVTKNGLWFGHRRCQPAALEIGIILALCAVLATVACMLAVIASARNLRNTFGWNAIAVLFAWGTWRFCWRSR